MQLGSPGFSSSGESYDSPQGKAREAPPLMYDERSPLLVFDGYEQSDYSKSERYRICLRVTRPLRFTENPC